MQNRFQEKLFDTWQQAFISALEIHKAAPHIAPQSWAWNRVRGTDKSVPYGQKSIWGSGYHPPVEIALDEPARDLYKFCDMP